ncbi:LOW QUALITY PROTEIN: Tim44 domain-containing protein [Cephalotus follicularis]|uniref:Tim44 domain-containing protein n=1 Tax=Cephalotus follicularis TaxID=3775 RepID=A0A1Q3B615_CEPFO|nr:LOW QUALITY PROTEIN: Tim44 domain-containing protein [Cephalotus follicularis]
MAFLRRLHTFRSLYRTLEIQEYSFLLGSSRSYLRGFSNVPELNSRRMSSCLYRIHSSALPWTHRSTMTLRSTVVPELSIFLNEKRLATTQAKAPPQMRQMGAFQVSMLSPGLIYEPYAPRDPISFWRRWFTKSGWRRTKDDVILELKSAYAIAKLRKSGYKKHQFYQEAIELYKEINTLMANGDKATIRKAVTEKMYSIGVDRDDLNKVFIQLTLEFLTKQKFEAYDSNGAVVAGDKTKEAISLMSFKVYKFLRFRMKFLSFVLRFVHFHISILFVYALPCSTVLVRDIWVFEKSLFHREAFWRLCGRISV